MSVETEGVVTYLEKLPKDIIGYLRGFTGPDLLYQIPHQIMVEKENGNVHYYSMYATSIQVQIGIDNLIKELSFKDRLSKFRNLSQVPDSVHRIGVNTRREWSDPVKTITIDGRMHMVMPLKLHIPRHIYKSVAEFKRQVLNFDPKMKKCKGIGCDNKCPKQLDYCGNCLDLVRDTKYHDPNLLRKRRRERTVPKFHAVKKPHRVRPNANPLKKKRRGTHRFRPGDFHDA